MGNSHVPSASTFGGCRQNDPGVSTNTASSPHVRPSSSEIRRRICDVHCMGKRPSKPPASHCSRVIPRVIST